ncbi:MAG: thioredoxin [Roseburia sp.]|nr:thioredoxin [Roseburia sp.]MCM1096584.1 thioredoxin [Ruminococcus flavefaciens]
MEYQLKTENFDEEVLQASVPVLVDFYADWCGPCKMMAPVVAKLAEEFEGRLKVGKCNVDDNMQLAQRYRITSIPAFLIFRDGEVAESFVGAVSASELKKKLEQVLM